MGTRVLPIAEPRYSDIIGRPIDNTALVAFNCHWKYLASMIWHRRKEGAPPPGIAMGSNWHHCLEAHYKYVPPPTLRPGDIQLRSESAAKDLREAILEDIYGFVEVAVTDLWEDHQHPDDHRTFRRLMMDYRSYLKKYGLPWEGEDKTFGWPENPFVELAGELAVPGARHPYTYKIDRMFRSQGQFYLEDHKSSSRVIDFNQYTLDNQMIGYAASAWLLTGELIAGVRINGIIIHKNDTVFERQTIPFGRERLLDWMENLDPQLEEIERRTRWLREGAVPEKAFPRNYTICAGKYGMCQYAGICSIPPEMRQQALEDDFAVIPWNPLEAKGEVVADA